MKRAAFRFLLLITLVSAAPAFADSATAIHPGLKNTVVMIIRHAEKPENGFELSPAGQKRAEAYAGYFKKLDFGGESLKPDYLIATADSKASHRPRLTIEPTGRALGLHVNSGVKNKDFAGLVTDLQARHHGKHVLICWHHGEIPTLAEALGADPAKLLPKGKWPSEEFGWTDAGFALRRGSPAGGKQMRPRKIDAGRRLNRKFPR